MTRLLSNFLMLFAVLVLVACGGESNDKPNDNDAGKHADDGDADADEQADGDEHEDHGDRHELGKTQVDGYAVTVALLGDVEAGHEAVIDVSVADKAAEAMRAWVGLESGKGSMRAKIDGEDGDYHGHLEVPDPLPAGSAIWIELEGTDGKRSKTSFAFNKQ